MKTLILALIWCAVAFLSLLTLYNVVPPQAQYTLAEHFHFYGDEMIMDFVLYVFFSAAVVIASVITFILFLLTRKNS